MAMARSFLNTVTLILLFHTVICLIRVFYHFVFARMLYPVVIALHHYIKKLIEFKLKKNIPFCW